MVRKADRLWALYKGDELLNTGTIVQLSRRTGKTCDHLMYMTTPAYKRKQDLGNKMQMFEIEDD